MKKYLETSYEISLGSSKRTKSRIALFAFLLLMNITAVVSTAIHSICPRGDAQEVTPSSRVDERP